MNELDDNYVLNREVGLSPVIKKTLLSMLSVLPPCSIDTACERNYPYFRTLHDTVY